MYVYIKKLYNIYFEVKEQKFARFSLLPKIHKRLNNMSGRLEYLIVVITH